MEFELSRHAASEESSEQSVYQLNEPALQWLATGWPTTDFVKSSATRAGGPTMVRARSKVYCHAARRRHLRALTGSPFDRLTQREKEVFRYIALGKSNKYIAQELGVSQRTVEAHRSRVFSKMRVRNAVELVRCTTAYVLTQGRSSRFWQLIGVEPTGAEVVPVASDDSDSSNS